MKPDRMPSRSTAATLAQEAIDAARPRREVSDNVEIYRDRKSNSARVVVDGVDLQLPAGARVSQFSLHNKEQSLVKIEILSKRVEIFANNVTVEGAEA